MIGTRPQFIKHASLEMAARGKMDIESIHTGQHYDENMSSIFFDQLKINTPKYNLAIDGSSHGTQTATMIIGIEEILLDEKPDFVLVYGDSNTTLAGAISASKLNIPIAHVEAGLRSFNKNMPEEINRILTDHTADTLFCSSPEGIKNLSQEGIKNGVFLVGDIMKDLVLYITDRNSKLDKLYNFDFYYATLHRPYNVDNKDRLMQIFDVLNTLNHKVVFAIHPRTKVNVGKYQIDLSKFENIHVIESQSYFKNLDHITESLAVITDSGGIQKEAYWLHKKCVTIRSETEWTETLKADANTLVFENLQEIQYAINLNPKEFDDSLYGFGNAGSQIVDTLINNYQKNLN